MSDLWSGVRKYVLKRDDGVYTAGQFRGRANTVKDIYDAARYTQGGAKSARGWVNDKERWSVVPVIVIITEEAAN
ncbi:hypothetical protein [Paenibacillus planticolens]|uniref:Uncharacterized protein n=1 Tax=Paenibacillus planticolens TaxID=2654976 RepID=A0ABX1ZI77_9BACL|nr:hypothetical protein [Paenibacillus planticolens]NOU98458.1 hypothetical protein [Paenibacillus planticolens]